MSAKVSRCVGKSIPVCRLKYPGVSAKVSLRVANPRSRTLGDGRLRKSVLVHSKPQRNHQQE